MINVPVTHKVKSSAIATEHQTPLIPRISGSRRTIAIWKTSVLRNEISAESRPLFNAVKNAEP